MVSQRGSSKDVLILGVGNPYRQDDGLGPYVVDHYHDRLSGLHVRCRTGSAEGFDLIEAWKDHRRVVLVDAAKANNPPGTLYRFDVSEKPMPKAMFTCSTHALSLADTVELARAMDELPKILVVLGLVGKSFEMARGLTEEVESKVDELVDRIEEEAERLQKV